MSDGEWPRPEDFFDAPDDAPVGAENPRTAPSPPSSPAATSDPSTAPTAPVSANVDSESPPAPLSAQATQPAPSGSAEPIRPSENARRQPVWDQEPAPLVPRGGVFEGQIAVVGETRIEGRVNGTLKGPGTLILEPDARIEGLIDCEAIESQGQILGPVAVRQRARFYGAARLDGDLAAPAVEVQDAALWIGDAKIGR